MAYKFGLFDGKIAVWNSAENYGTAVDLDAIQLASITVNTVNGVLEGDDAIKAVFAKIISATLRVRFAFTDFNAWTVLTGVTATDSASVDSIKFVNDNLPYFAFCCRIDHDSGGGDLHLFLPKCKVTEGFEIGAEYGRFMTPEITVMAISEGSTYGVLKGFQHDTAQAVTIPPT